MKTIVAVIIILGIGGGIFGYQHYKNVATTTNTGVHGQILVGPTCPVERVPPDPNCADKPWSTFVQVFYADEKTPAYISTESDQDGRFSIPLSPGEYSLRIGRGNFPNCPPTYVKVEPDKYTSITINCDSGIR